MNATADAFMSIFGMSRVKPKTCKACRCKFTPSKPLQTVCGPQCAAEVAAKQRKAHAVAKAKEERKAIKAKKEKLKTRSDYIKEAQIEFNRYIRFRDEGKPCICCGQPLDSVGTGGAFDCGHYRSVGSAPHHRFNENNAAGQRKQCNRYGAGRAVDYRMGLIGRIGLQAVEALESDNEPRKWTIEELKAIKAHYKKKTKDLQCQQMTPTT